MTVHLALFGFAAFPAIEGAIVSYVTSLADLASRERALLER